MICSRSTGVRLDATFPLRSMLGLVIGLCIAFAAPQVMGQRLGDQVWVDLEAERVEEDGFAEGLAISVHLRYSPDSDRIRSGP